MRCASQLLLATNSNLAVPSRPSFSRILSPRLQRAYTACKMSAQPQADAAPAAAQPPQKVKKPAIAKEAFFVYSGPPPVRHPLSTRTVPLVTCDRTRLGSRGAAGLTFSHDMFTT